MKTILGLDLGSGSIGWAVVREDENTRSIERLGSRIVPLSTDDATQFTTGKAITKNSERTAMRTQRKGYDRYGLRRRLLTDYLHRLGMAPDERLIKLPQVELWGLRAKAVHEKIELPELGRVLYHLNQKRGYKSGKADFQDKKSSEYLAAVSGRYKEIQERGITIGEKFYAELQANPDYRCKDQVFPRAAYVEEFDRIMACQRQFHAILTDEHIAHLRDYIIYYQRPLKSCKHLVGDCTLASVRYVRPDGTVAVKGVKVAPRTSPLFQVCKIEQSLNNLELRNKRNERFEMTAMQHQALFDFMNQHEKLKLSDLQKILGISKSDGWWGGKAIGTGLQGNTTYTAVAKALKGGYSHLLRFDLKVKTEEFADPDSGEVVERKIIDESFEQEPFYRLWHTLYSIDDMEVLDRILQEKFGIDDAGVRHDLCALDFVKAGYSNLSSAAMRRILPYLQMGYGYAEACFMAGYNHSNSLTKDENLARELKDKLAPIAKGDLRQPVVEKILNQMINLVNALMQEYGRFDEIRVELARELKQSREEREKADKNNRERESHNKFYAEKISEMNLSPTRSRVQKYRMYEESQHLCMYCGQPVNLTAFLQGYDTEVEHIIPRSLYFDDSFANKVCSCRKCNQEKGNRTAYDYMASQGEGTLAIYLERIKKMYEEHKISKQKYSYLMMRQRDIPQDFLNRQMRESQYMARKALDILRSVCRSVYATGGGVTAYLRHIWGWDLVLHDLNIDRYRAGGLTEIREVNHVDTECIKDWSKRLDHRHHAVDALAIACTRQGYIQRLNTLSALSDEEGDAYMSLDRYMQEQPHFSYAEVRAAVEKILISFKAGKRVATQGKRYIHRGGKRILVQQGIVVPRGALSEQSVYGVIRRYEKNKKGETSLRQEYVIKYPVTAIDEKTLPYVIDGGIREILRRRLEACGGNARQAYAEPLYTAAGKRINTVRCFTGLSAVVPVKYDGDRPVGFVKPGNNHHIAIYTDRDGKLHEHVVTFWHAVERKKFGLPVVIEHPDAVWDSVTDAMPESFLSQLPDVSWKFEFSMQQNEMFILGMPDDLYADAMENGDYALLGKYLYRVQKLGTGAYVFRFHIETASDDRYVDETGKKTFNLKLSQKMNRVRWIASLDALRKVNPHKVKIDLLGRITAL